MEPNNHGDSGEFPREDMKKNFLIYTNQNKDPHLEITHRIQKYLEDCDQIVSLALKDEDTESAIEDVNCMIVLGGDGTVLRAVREIGNRHIPIIGVNLGTLGYMTEIELEHLEEALERLVVGDYVQESRMMLNGQIEKNGETVENGWALNDIVISRRGCLQIITFDIYVNGQFLNAYQADGVIVTTATGSTGYNLSAGGPIIEPKAQLIMITPICPHTLNRRSIILSPEDIVEIVISEGKEGKTQAVDVNFDGTHTVELYMGDKVRITRSEKYTEFIQLNQVSFLDVLHKKLSES